MIEAVPLLLAVGVKVAVRMRPVPETVERVPPARVMSALVKEAPGSRLKVKVIVVESPALRAAAALVMVTVGVVGVPAEIGRGGGAEEGGAIVGGGRADIAEAWFVSAVDAGICDRNSGPRRHCGGQGEADGGSAVAEGGGQGGGIDADAVHQHREAVDAGECGAEGLTEADRH